MTTVLPETLPMPRESKDRMIAVVDQLALLVALTVALAFPLGYCAPAYRDLVLQVDTLAQAKAGAVTELVNDNPKLWAHELPRIEELLARYPVPVEHEAASAYDANGVLLAHVGEPPAWPLLRRARPLYDSGHAVGRLEVSSSLRGLIYGGALAALAGMLLGGAVFAAFRTWPRRALLQMNAALAAEHAAARAREERFRMLFDRAGDGIIIVAPGGKLLAANDSFARMHGYSVQELLDMNLRDLDTPKTRERLAERLQGILSGDRATFEVEHYRKDGRVIALEVSSSVVLSEGEPLIQAFHRDITERKQAEAERTRLEEQLRQSQKMEALGTLAGGVAHDFNNALATIFGNVVLARQDLDPAHAAQESLAEIDKAARRAKALVQQILAFGRRQPMERTPVSLAPTVEETARLLRATLPAGVSLAIVCAPDTPTVLADALQVQQILLNLCTNAWQAIQADSAPSPGRPGMIEIRLEAHEGEQAANTAPQWQRPKDCAERHPRRYARLTVRDNGPGMDAATQQRIFDPFFTTKPVNQGTGLGLAVVHGIVQAHEARIEVQSAPGEGTAFQIDFAAIESPAFDAAQAGARSAGGQDGETALVLQGEGRQVLYVDDDEAIVFLMTRLLERQGYRVSGHSDAKEALAAVRADPRKFDLAVTDYNMPGMSGLELAQALKEIRPDLPVAVASGYITDELRQRAPAAGVSELIYKPNTVTELCEAITRLAKRLPA